MASKYLQKYQVPEGFYDILHEFTREVLRAQPDDILDYAANYFEHKSEGRDYYYESKSNVQKPKNHQPKQYNPTPHSNYAEQAKRVVDASNAKAVEVATHHENNNTASRQNSGHSSKPQRVPSSGPEGRPQTSNSVKSDKPNDTSKVSYHSKKSDVSHPEEKKITKEFVDDLYSSALHKAIGQSGVEDQEENEGGYQQEAVENEGTPGEEVGREEEEEEEEEQEREQEGGATVPAADQEEVVLDGPVEEYENVALKIQSVFRGNQVRKAKK